MKDRRKLLYIGLIFLLIGCLFISIPLYHELKHKQEVRALEEALLLLSNEEFSAVQNEENDVTPPQLSNSPNQKAIERAKGIMELEIPSIDLKQYVLAETNEENLKIGLTQIKAGQVPGEGNFTIAGHRGYRNDRFFSSLPNVEPGEELLLHTSDATYIYEVVSSEVIPPTHVAILEDDALKTEMTLITCTRDGKRRIAVKGELIKTQTL